MITRGTFKRGGTPNNANMSNVGCIEEINEKGYICTNLSNFLCKQCKYKYDEDDFLGRGGHRKTN